MGRIVGPGNVQPHVVKIVDVAAGNADMGSVVINMPGGPVGEFVFVPLSPPVTLLAFQQYFIVSHEQAGGDLWHDLATVMTTNVASLTSGVYNDDASPGYVLRGSPAQTYVPVSFRY